MRLPFCFTLYFTGADEINMVDAAGAMISEFS